MAACVGLLAPEIVRRSRAMKLGFITFGGAAFVISILMIVSMATAIAFPGLALVLEAGAIVLYGLGPSPKTGASTGGTDDVL
jgi:hypothetical protein